MTMRHSVHRRRCPPHWRDPRHRLRDRPVHPRGVPCRPCGRAGAREARSRDQRHGRRSGDDREDRACPPARDARLLHAPGEHGGRGGGLTPGHDPRCGAKPGVADSDRQDRQADRRAIRPLGPMPRQRSVPPWRETLTRGPHSGRRDRAEPLARPTRRGCRRLRVPEEVHMRRAFAALCSVALLLTVLAPGATSATGDPSRAGR